MTRTADKLSTYQSGVTLIELVVSIVVISIGLAGVLLVMERNTRFSADPLVQHQAIAIGEAYLEEILLKDFCDPSSTCTPPNAPGTPGCDVCPAAEGVRNQFDNVCDYNGMNESPTDQFGTPIGGLSSYAVQVNVSTADTLNGVAGGSCRLLRVQVNVSGPAGTNVVLSGYRTNY